MERVPSFASLKRSSIQESTEGTTTLNFFAFDLRKMAIILVIIALPFLSVNMQRGPGDEAWYRRPISVIVGSLQNSYAVFTGEIRGTTSTYLKLIGIKKYNANLLKENEELHAELGALTELRLENERLNKILDFKQKSKMKSIAARVISRDLSPDHYSIRINRGFRDGLQKLQAVITVAGVVGYVFKPEAHSSQVLLVTDRAASIDAIVQSTRARGLVQGKTKSLCRLRYLERADDVAVGDLVVTSGLQGIFPKGFPIGKINSVKKTEFGISQEAEIVPIVNPTNLEEVLVVLDSGNEDYSNKNGGGEFGPPLLSKQFGYSSGTPRLDTTKIQAASTQEKVELPKANTNSINDPSPVRQGE